MKYKDVMEEERMSSAKKCDKCKEFFDGPEPLDFRLIKGREGFVIDLCPKCHENLVNWFNEKDSSKNSAL